MNLYVFQSIRKSIHEASDLYLHDIIILSKKLYKWSLNNDMFNT